MLGLNHTSAALVDLAFLGERDHNLVEYTIDEGATALSRVVLSNLDVLVECNLDGD